MKIKLIAAQAFLLTALNSVVQKENDFMAAPIPGLVEYCVAQNYAGVSFSVPLKNITN